MGTTTRDFQPKIVTPEDATVINAFGGVVITLRAEDTGGQYSVVDFTVEPNPHSLAQHVHQNFDEIYHVVEGTLSVTVDSEQWNAPAGSSVFIPRGTVHTFTNQGDTPARFVFVMSPGGFERSFDELIAAVEAHGEVTPEVFAEIVSRYDVTIVESD